MSDDEPTQLKPRLEIARHQAQSIIDRVAPRSSVLGVTELHGGQISAVFEIALKDAPACILKVYPAALQWKMAKEVYVLGLLRDIGTAVPRILLADDTRSLIDLNFVKSLRTPHSGVARMQRSEIQADAGRPFPLLA